MPLNSLHALLSPGLLDSVTRRYGPPVIARMPAASPEREQTGGLAELLADLAAADVVLFPDIWPGDLDGFFRLRLLQVLDREPPPRALSVVVLCADMQGPPLPAGFAERFRSSWPFARCVFLTEGEDHEKLSEQIGLPVGRLEHGAEVLSSDADAGQQIALQVQKSWGMCGSTILFENQVESLVRAGFLTIRLFTDAQWRRGATLSSRLDRVLRENSVHTGAHINAVAVPDGAPYSLAGGSPDIAWRKLLLATASCRIHDPAVMRAAEQAACVIANHIDCVGPTVALAPQARLLLALHEDRSDSLYRWALQTGKTEAVASLYANASARVQTPLLAIADICTFTSMRDLAHLGPHCRRAVGVLPRVYTVPPPDGVAARFDLLLVGAEHGPNILSMRWFLDEVWRPHLEPRSVSIAIVGRAGRHVQNERSVSPLLHFLGFVEDLEAIRSWCRLTVVPDRGGSGISTKMLTSIASGRPLSTTSIGLRGLDLSITAELPAYDDADALAADILALIGDPARLAERRDRVRAARQASYRMIDHAALAMSPPLPDGSATRERLARWERIVGATRAADVTTGVAVGGAPYCFGFDAAFALSGGAADPQVLLDGWHEPERWGRWTDGTVASMRINLAAPTDEPLTVELDIVPSAIRTNLRIGIDGIMLPLIDPVLGWNAWDIPAELSAGKTSFVLSLHAGEAVCPARTGDSPDDRILGIGVAAVRIVRRQPSVVAFDAFVPVNAGSMPRKLLLTGWHPPEDWGCWTSRPAASLRLTMAERPRDGVRLELNLAPTPANPPLTVSVNNVTLPAIVPVDGFNRWDLPAEVTDKRLELLVRLAVAEMFCPAGDGASADTRDLGVGLRGVRLTSFAPVYATPGEPLALCQPAALGEVLLEGWHAPEERECWSSQRNAVLRLMFRKPLAGAFRLELDLAAVPVGLGVTAPGLATPGLDAPGLATPGLDAPKLAAPRLAVSVNGETFPEIVPVSGANHWTLPERLTNGERTLLIQLRTSDMFRPSALGIGRDNRSLGVGVRSVTLRRDAAALCPIGLAVRISSELEDSGVLLTGWHVQEDWGRWSSGSDASLLLRFDTPLSGNYGLELDLMPPVLDKYVALSVNGTILPPVAVIEGVNDWDLPSACTDGQTSLRVHLLVALPARPMDVSDSTDDRLLGVGLRSFRFRSGNGG